MIFYSKQNNTITHLGKIIQTAKESDFITINNLSSWTLKNHSIAKEVDFWWEPLLCSYLCKHECRNPHSQAHKSPCKARAFPCRKPQLIIPTNSISYISLKFRPKVKNLVVRWEWMRVEFDRSSLFYVLLHSLIDIAFKGFPVYWESEWSSESWSCLEG